MVTNQFLIPDETRVPVGNSPASLKSMATSHNTAKPFTIRAAKTGPTILKIFYLVKHLMGNI